jgi:hypothetical protein
MCKIRGSVARPVTKSGRGLANLKRSSAAFLSFHQQATTALLQHHQTRGFARIPRNVASTAGRAHGFDIEPGPSPRRAQEGEEQEATK